MATLKAIESIDTPMGTSYVKGTMLPSEDKWILKKESTVNKIITLN